MMTDNPAMPLDRARPWTCVGTATDGGRLPTSALHRTIASIATVAKGTSVSSTGLGADAFGAELPDTAAVAYVGPSAWSPPV